MPREHARCRTSASSTARRRDHLPPTRPKRYTVTVKEPFDRKRYQQAAEGYGLTMDEFFRFGGDYLVILLDKWEGWR